MKRLHQSVLVVAGILFLGLAGWSGYQVRQLSSKRAQIKQDYAAMNNITYGLLSVNAWRDHLINIVSHRIDDFEFTPEQEKALNYEISQVLHAVIDKADSMVDQKQKTIGGKIKKLAVKTLVKEDKLHEKVPAFSRTIVNELKKPKNKEKLKFIARSKLEEFGTITYDSATDVARIENLLKRYQATSLTDFNTNSITLLDDLQHRTYMFTFIMLGIMIFFLMSWWILRRQPHLHTPFFIVSLLLALVVLITGLISPMIEIDARIKQLSFLLIGERITFNDQVLFFQSKSIVDVVTILIQTGKFDSALVGILILAFSIIFPIGKLVASKIYVLGNEKWRANRFVCFFAFKSGKWSMADVNVVAIFMAYIGFKGILDSQLGQLNMQTETLASISTNETTLQPGFILFIGFVLFGLILSSLLRKITQSKEEKVFPVSKPLTSLMARPA
jgi:hypothetical protein